MALMATTRKNIRIGGARRNSLMTVLSSGASLSSTPSRPSPSLGVLAAPSPCFGGPSASPWAQLTPLWRSSPSPNSLVRGDGLRWATAGSAPRGPPPPGRPRAERRASLKSTEGLTSREAPLLLDSRLPTSLSLGHAAPDLDAPSGRSSTVKTLSLRCRNSCFRTCEPALSGSAIAESPVRTWSSIAAFSLSISSRASSSGVGARRHSERAPRMAPRRSR
mmetsp:Transcript_67776/g.199046  ORF Transcript_67776/g.199046 Transcript_67776/m.199046 type:complete len:220 (+) Transcript_67776:198-857(+)